MWQCLVLVYCGLGLTIAATDRPVIGILDQPLSSDPSKTYIAASYVKWLEAGGARVIPLHYQDPVRLAALAEKLNGILFTGGGTDLSKGGQFWNAGKALYDKAKQIFDNGGYLPIWGTCMGFQFLSVLTADADSVLETGFDSEDLPIPLNFTKAAAASRMFSSASPAVIHDLATQDITMNNHHDGVTPDTYARNQQLNSFFTVLSTNVDRKGREFVSTIEGKKYPFFGTQWHPEKNPWEWTVNEHLPHSPIAVLATQFTSNFIVNQARNSTNAFTEDELKDLLIYNFRADFTGKTGSDFTQQYIWPQ
jgi:gamma-glutamyl hydrolase